MYTNTPCWSRRCMNKHISFFVSASSTGGRGGAHAAVRNPDGHLREKGLRRGSHGRIVGIILLLRLTLLVLCA